MDTKSLIIQALYYPDSPDNIIWYSKDNTKLYFSIKIYDSPELDEWATGEIPIENGNLQYDKMRWEIEDS